MEKNDKRGETFTAKLESVNPTGNYDDYGKEYEFTFDNGVTVKKKYKNDPPETGKAYSVLYDHFWGDSEKGSYDFKNGRKIDLAGGGSTTQATTQPQTTTQPNINNATILKEVVFLNSAVLSAAGAVSNDPAMLEANIEKIRTLVWGHITSDFERLSN